MNRTWLAYGAAGIVAVGFAMLPVTAAPALAAVVISVNGTTGADASACGAPSAPCRTIQYAYSRRAASGGTIKVAAGTYDLARSFLIDGVANVAFDGAQAGVDAKGRSPACSDKTETVITTTSSALPIKTALFDAEKDGITVNGFCFKGGSPNGVVGLESSAAGPDGGGASASGFMFENNIFTRLTSGLWLGSDGKSVSTVRDNLFYAETGQGGLAAGVGVGLYSSNQWTPLHNAVIEQNSFKDNPRNPIRFAQTLTPPGRGTDITIRDNVFVDSPGYISMYGISDSTVTGNTMTGGNGGIGAFGDDHNVTISGNTISDMGGNGFVSGDCLGAVPNSGITIAGNKATRVTGNSVFIFSTNGVAVRDNMLLDSGNDGIEVDSPADADASLCGLSPPTSEVTTGATVTQDTIAGSAGAASGIDVAAGSYAGPMAIHFNRIVDSVSGHGLVNDEPAAVIDARDNWWGCNTMPAGVGCDHLAGAAVSRVSFSPWLVLRISSTPADIAAGQKATITSDLAHGSGGAATGGPFFAPATVHFTTTPGHVAPASMTTNASLHAQTTWPAGQPRPKQICSTVDNQTTCLKFSAAMVALHVTMTATPNPFIVGVPETYMLTVSNGGPNSAGETRITDPLPGGAAHFTWRCTPSPAPTSCARSSGAGSIDTTAIIAAHGHVTYTITGSLPAGADAGDRITNTARVTPAPGTKDPGCTPHCTTTITVTVSSELPVTGPNLMSAAVTGIGLLLAGVTVLLATRRRRARATTTTA